MAYRISESVRGKIQQIPKFKTGINKIKNIATVKSNYGIASSENIISYRVVPKLLAKLETGGTIFTNEGVYRRLPSGYLSSDYVTAGIKYTNIVDYIPYLGYSMDRQPQLIGEHTGHKDISFWLTPVAGTESNDAIVEVFKAIIADVVGQDAVLLGRYQEGKRKFFERLKGKFESDGCFPDRDEKVLRSLIKADGFEGKLKEDAIYLVFQNRFAGKDYYGAYSFVENNSGLMDEQEFVERIDPIIRGKLKQ